MKWYILTQTTNRNVIGNADNQSECSARFDAAKYLYELVPEHFKVPGFKLHHHAKLTDLVQSVNTSPVRPLIGQKLLDILMQFKTVPISRALPAVLIGKKGEELPYYVYVQHADFTATDYERSIFCKPAGFNEKWEPAYEDLKVKVGSLREVIDQGGVGPRALYINDSIPWDFFVLAGPPFLWMAQDHVVEALQEAQITGICYIPFQPGDDFVNDDIVSKAMRAEGLK
ncbi:MAG: hypothetical protein KF852_08890 [Saprospiraceae bacterium]|nr:hypothetical protein [Saprospiraceae bacterium]